MKVAYKINGKKVSAAQFRRHKMHCAGSGMGSYSVTQAYSDSTPGRSMAMNCNPSQVGLLNETIQQHGIQGIHYKVDDRGRGKCVITSRRGRAQWIPIFGRMHGISDLHDEDGGYGDG